MIVVFARAFDVSVSCLSAAKWPGSVYRDPVWPSHRQSHLRPGTAHTGWDPFSVHRRVCPVGSGPTSALLRMTKSAGFFARSLRALWPRRPRHFSMIRRRFARIFGQELVEARVDDVWTAGPTSALLSLFFVWDSRTVGRAPWTLMTCGQPLAATSSPLRLASSL